MITDQRLVPMPRGHYQLWFAKAETTEYFLVLPVEIARACQSVTDFIHHPELGNPIVSD